MDYNKQTNPFRLCEQFRSRVLHPNLINGFHEKFYPGKFCIMGSVRLLGSYFGPNITMEQLDLKNVEIVREANAFIEKVYKIQDFFAPNYSLLFHGFEGELNDHTKDAIKQLENPPLISVILVVGCFQHLRFNPFELQTDAQCREDYKRSKWILSALLNKHCQILIT